MKSGTEFRADSALERGVPEEKPSQRIGQAAKVILAVLLYGLLFDVFVESWIEPSRTRWLTTTAVVTYGVLTYTLWKRMSWGLRAGATILILLSLLAVSSWMLGSASANHGLMVFRQPPGRTAALVGLLALSLGYWMIARHPGLTVKARLAIALPFLYCALPLLRGIFAAASFEATLRGEGFWEWPPLWLQGGYLGMRILLPLALVAALGSLATNPAMRRPGRVRQSLFEAALILLVLAVVQPSLDGLEGEAQSFEVVGESVSLEKVGENSVLRITLDSFVLEEEVLGEKAPEGSRFLSVTARIANRSAEKRLSIPSVEQTFLLEQGDGTQGRLHPLSGRSNPPLWGSIELAPGEEREVAMIFTASSAQIAEASLVFARTDQGSMAVPLGDPKRMAPPLAGPGVAGELEISVRKAALVEEVAGVSAPEGRAFLSVDLRLRNLRELQPLDTLVSDLSQVVEDRFYVYPPHSLTRQLSPRLATPSSFLAGVPVQGTLVFLVPEEAGDLAFVYHTPEGSISLDLTPARQAPKRPEVGAGPAGDDARVSLSLLARDADVEFPAPSAGHRYVVLDVLLALNVDDPMASFPFQPHEVLELHDEQGRVFRASDVGSLLRRPLGSVELWRDQPARGEVVFSVPDDSSSFTLVLPFSGSPVRLPVPEVLASGSGSG
jgi:hypothetical protein